MRLWSMETGSNVVCYKSHNYPVWDVSFSPLGYYFATGMEQRGADRMIEERTYGPVFVSQSLDNQFLLPVTI